MKQECPMTGDACAVTEAPGLVIVDHPRFGEYSVDADAVPVLGADRALREQLGRWFAESRSLGIDIPYLTMQHVHLLERLTELMAAAGEWAEYRETISDPDNERLWRKLRLEWNYNTNHIEGNTLTYRETELLLIYGRTAGGHPMRDYEEMKAHDVAIDHTRQLAKDERVLGEGDIRDLNKILLKEPFWQIAETSDGQPTRVRIVPGKYKIHPNHVRTPTGELHRYAEPEETPALMGRWTHDFQRDLRRSAYPLPLFLAGSHWSLLHIHPFGDGNGRTSRLLTNYVLLRHNLPPIVIKSAERDRYIGALQEADLGRMMPLALFMLDNVLWSLGMAVRAAKGESIDEPDDVDKEIAVFVRRHQGGDPDRSHVEILDEVFHRWIRPTVEQTETALQPVCQLFYRNFWHSHLGIDHGQLSPPDVLLRSEDWERTKKNHVVRPGFQITDDKPIELGRRLRFHQYTGRGARAFDLTLSFGWNLNGAGVVFEAELDGLPIPSAGRRFRYSDFDTCDLEVDHTVDTICKALMTEITRRSEEGI